MAGNPHPKLSNLTNAGKGRPKGSKNKANQLLDMVFKVIKKNGGVKFFETMLEKDKHDFHMIVKEIMPRRSEVESENKNKNVEDININYDRKPPDPPVMPKEDIEPSQEPPETDEDAPGSIISI